MDSAHSNACAPAEVLNSAHVVQAYAGSVQEFKDSAGLEETSVGYVIAGNLGGSPKSPQYGLLKRGVLDDKEQKKLNKCPAVSGLESDCVLPAVCWRRE